MISDALTAVIAEQLGLEDLQLTEDTKAWEVPGWDSLMHMRIIAAVEQRFKIRLRGLEVMGLKKIGDLQALVDRKTKKG